MLRSFERKAFVSAGVVSGDGKGYKRHHSSSKLASIKHERPYVKTGNVINVPISTQSYQRLSLTQREREQKEAIC